jgi:hypothetical protein
VVVPVDLQCGRRLHRPEVEQAGLFDDPMRHGTFGWPCS